MTFTQRCLIRIISINLRHQIRAFIYKNPIFVSNCRFYNKEK